MLSSRRTPNSRASKFAKRGETALDRKQAALSETEKQLQLKTEQLKQLIDDAPRLREEQTRRRREQLAADTRLTSRRSLADPRHTLSATITMNPSFGTRRLRSERRDGKLMFVFLCFVLTVIFYSIWAHFAR